MLELQRDSDFRQPPIKLLSNRPILYSAILRSLIEIESVPIHMVRLLHGNKGIFLYFFVHCAMRGPNSVNVTTRISEPFFFLFFFIHLIP